MIPSELKIIYTQLIRPEDSPPDSEDILLHSYVKAADRLDAYLKCVWEVAAGNREFAAAKEQTAAKLRGLGLQEVDYFLTHMAPSFEMSLDELSAGN